MLSTPRVTLGWNNPDLSLGALDGLAQWEHPDLCESSTSNPITVPNSCASLRSLIDDAHVLLGAIEKRKSSLFFKKN